jgi:uncharacterized protein YxjI
MLNSKNRFLVWAYIRIHELISKSIEGHALFLRAISSLRCDKGKKQRAERFRAIVGKWVFYCSDTFGVKVLEGERSYVALGWVVFLFNMIHCDDVA